jgi:hypothetical protein
MRGKLDAAGRPTSWAKIGFALKLVPEGAPKSQAGDAARRAFKQVRGAEAPTGPQRPGDPPPLGAGVLRVLVLLAGFPRRASRRGRPTSAQLAGRHDGRAGAGSTGHRRRTRRQQLVAGGVAGGAGLADPMERAAALLAVVVASAPTSNVTTAA